MRANKVLVFVLAIGVGMVLAASPGLAQQKKPVIGLKTKFKSKYLTSFVFGAAFAVGWTPCVGAVLGGILALAATQPGVAFTLLFSYSLGLGIPFLVVALFAAPAAGLFYDR